MHSTLEHAILYRKGKGQFNVYFKDVVKGIEMKLNGEIGKIKSKCLEVEERNKQLVGKAASHKIKNLTNIVEMQRTKENIRSMRVACDRALSRTNLAHKQIDKIRVKALQSEETSHELRTRAEGIQFQISATKTDIYATNDKTADRIRARDSMYTHQEFREAKELRKDLGAKLETIKVEYAEVFHQTAYRRRFRWTPVVGQHGVTIGVCFQATTIVVQDGASLPQRSDIWCYNIHVLDIVVSWKGSAPCPAIAHLQSEFPSRPSLILIP